MKMCLRCNTHRYTKKKSYCPKCKNVMVHIDGRLRKVVEVLHSLDLRVAFAYCDAHMSSDLYMAEIIIGLSVPYSKFLFEELPEHFAFLSDKYRDGSLYSLNYLLNHLGKLMSMIVFDYTTGPDGMNSPQIELGVAIKELYEWALGLKDSGRWAVWKLRGD